MRCNLQILKLFIILFIFELFYFESYYLCHSSVCLLNALVRSLLEDDCHIDCDY